VNGESELIATGRNWIFLCAFRNEASVLPAYLEEMRQVLTRVEAVKDASIVMVDDLSFDDSAGVIQRWSDDHPEMDIKVLTVSTNLGTQGALAFGLNQIQPLEPERQWIFSMDPDGEDDLQQIPDMMAQARAQPEKVIYSQRSSRLDSLRMKLLYYPFLHLYRHMTGKSILPNNFMVLPARYRNPVRLTAFLPVYYALATLRLGLPHSTHASARRQRYGGHSTQNLYNLITHALVGLMIFHETVIARVYTYIALACGLFLAGNGFAFFVKFLQNKAVPDGFTSTYITINVGFGVVLLAMLGITAALSMMLKLAGHYLTRWNMLMGSMEMKADGLHGKEVDR